MKRVRLNNGHDVSRSSHRKPARKRNTVGSTSNRKSAPKIQERASEAVTPYVQRTRREKGRWPKGVSGNRAGRRKGSKNKRTVIIEMMEAKLGRKIPDPKNLTAYEGMFFKAIQKSLGGDIRAMSFAFGEYKKAIEANISMTAAATTEEDQQAYEAMREKIRREIEEEVRAALRAEIRRELIKKYGW